MAKKKKDNFFLMFLMVVVLIALLIVGNKIVKLNLSPEARKRRASQKRSLIKNKTRKKKESGKKAINIFFIHKNLNMLYPEEREIPVGNTVLESTGILLNEILMGPRSPEGKNIYMDALKVRGYYMVDDLLYLDFNRFLLKGGKLGTREVILKFYSFVNTLAQLREGLGIVFLLEGKTILQYGNLNFELPFYAKPELSKM
ncbi:GerMN domain-containing protein [Candidatus Riflebacteria bacterium]